MPGRILMYAVSFIVDLTQDNIHQIYYRYDRKPDKEGKENILFRHMEGFFIKGKVIGNLGDKSKYEHS